MSDSRLKPCPFCGGSAEVAHGRYDGKETSYVRCCRCMAQGEFFFISFEHSSDDKAIKAWNAREVVRNESNTDKEAS